MSNESGEVSLSLHAQYDTVQEAVGIELQPSPAFEAVVDPQAVIEILAAVAAKANFLASEIIAAWEAEDDRKKELLDHFAGLKEHMLSSMLHEAERRRPS